MSRREVKGNNSAAAYAIANPQSFAVQESAGKQFDRKVISAMVYYIDNLGGAESLQSKSGPRREQA